MGSEKSDRNRYQDEENKLDQQDPNMKQKDKLISTLNQIGMSISKIEQFGILGLSKITIKKEIKVYWTHQTKFRIRQENIIGKENEWFILKYLAGNPFLRTTNIVTLFRVRFENLENREISLKIDLKRILMEKSSSRVKNQVSWVIKT